MAIVPPAPGPAYDRKLSGVYGEFGAGAGVTAFYLQATITPHQLDWISLISDIKGSQYWKVRDLFQRDLDTKRITESLLPYLQAKNRLKFFNPLTLTLLPMKEDGIGVLKEMPEIDERPIDKHEQQWSALERRDFYRFSWHIDYRQLAELEWNSTRSRLVAIDGQHRLSAFKRYLKDHGRGGRGDFMKWQIPVVIVSFRDSARGESETSVLEVVRSIFVYINKEAHRVSPAREILLSDESVNAVCVQELLEASHENDLEGPTGRNEDRLPLLFYDWRSEEHDKEIVRATAAVKDVMEVHAWFEHYILGENFSRDQKDALQIGPTVAELHQAFKNGQLDPSASRLLRKRFNEELGPAVSHLLEQFVPYRNYVRQLRALEREYMDDTRPDVSRHAFDQLRFGSSHVDDVMYEAIQEALGEIRARIAEIKKACFHAPFERDKREIGMRGVMAAFGGLAWRFRYPDWRDYAARFTDALNRAYSDGWLDISPKAARRGHLRHIVFDHNDSVVNYKLEHAEKALGCFVSVLTAAYGQTGPVGMRWPEKWHTDHEWTTWREERMEELEDVVIRGYKKEVRPILKEQDEFAAGGKPLTEAVNQEARKLARKQVRRLENALRNVE